LTAILLSILPQGPDTLFRARLSLMLISCLRSWPLLRSRLWRLSGMWVLYENFLRSIPERLPPLSGREKKTFGSVTFQILSITAHQCPEARMEVSWAEPCGVLYTRGLGESIPNGTLITIEASSAIRQAHGPEQRRRAALPSLAPPCGVLLHTPQSSLLGALHLTPCW
jgi:hypothetical protein